MTFNFLGSESIIGESHRLQSFGQAVDLAGPEAANAILGGCALLDGGTFDQIDFNKDELARFGSLALHEQAPPEFLKKKKAALIAAHALRERLAAGETLGHVLASTIQKLAPGETLPPPPAAPTQEVTEQ